MYIEEEGKGCNNKKRRSTVTMHNKEMGGGLGLKRVGGDSL
jgi:hypothetical protein